MLIWQLILIQIASSTIIILFLRWLLYSQIKRALLKLHKLNQQNLAKEKALKEELERARKQAEGEIARGRIEAGVIKERLKAESENESYKIIENARKEAKRTVDEGVRESQRKINDMVSQMQEKTAYLAADIIKYIFTQDIQKSLQGQLIDELIDEISNVPPDKLKVENHSIDIISAFVLDNKQKARIKDILSSKLGKDISLTSHLDESIVAGIVLRSGGFIIDGSIKNKLKKILPLMKGQAKK
jgi:F0F1-type ATP synthase membrane subunit b/b'